MNSNCIGLDKLLLQLLLKERLPKAIKTSAHAITKVLSTALHGFFTIFKIPSTTFSLPMSTRGRTNDSRVRSPMEFAKIEAKRSNDRGDRRTYRMGARRAGWWMARRRASLRASQTSPWSRARGQHAGQPWRIWSRHGGRLTSSLDLPTSSLPLLVRVGEGTGEGTGVAAVEEIPEAMATGRM